MTFGSLTINGQTSADTLKHIPKKTVTTKTHGDKITTTTTYRKGYKKTVIIETKKGECFVSKRKTIYNTRTTYLTVISSKEFLYDSLHCNKLIKKVTTK